MRLEGGSNLVLRVFGHTSCFALMVCELLLKSLCQGLDGEIMAGWFLSKKEAVVFRVEVTLCVIPSCLAGCRPLADFRENDDAIGHSKVLRVCLRFTLGNHQDRAGSGL